MWKPLFVPVSKELYISVVLFSSTSFKAEIECKKVFLFFFSLFIGTSIGNRKKFCNIAVS